MVSYNQSLIRLAALSVQLVGLLAFPLSLKGADNHNDLLKEAETRFLHGDYQQALDFYTGLCRLDPRNWIYRYNCGILCIEIGDRSTGINHFEIADSLDGKSPWSAFRLGQIYAAFNFPDSSDRWFAEGLRRDKQHLPCITAYAKRLAELGRIEDAIALSRDGVERNPNSPEAKCALAYCLSKSKRTEEAFEVIDRGIDHFPQDKLLKLGIALSRDTRNSVRLNRFTHLYEKHYQNLASLELAGCQSSSCDVENVKPSTRDYSWLKTGVRYVYKGYWGPIKLGTLELTILEPIDTLGLVSVPVIYRLKSNPVLFFFKVDDLFRAHMDIENWRTLNNDLTVDETWWSFNSRCEMHIAEGKLIRRTIGNDQMISVSEQELPDGLFDGVTILFFARRMVHDMQSGRGATLIDNDIDWTYLEFTGQRERVEIGGKHWDAWRVTGYMDYTGIAGLTGKFDARFSADGQALPLEANIKVFIGSISLVYHSEENIRANQEVE